MAKATVAFLMISVLVAGLGTIEAASPCCIIKSIDTKAQIVTAIEKATGRTFQFKVVDRLLLSRLKVGDPVIADFNTKRVAVKLSGTADGTSKPDGGGGPTDQPSDPAVLKHIPGPENPGGEGEFVFCCTMTNIQVPVVIH